MAETDLFVKKSVFGNQPGLSGTVAVDIMPAVTLWQPWACLIEIGAKRYETRIKPPPRRLIGQRIAIHAAARKMRAADYDEDTFEEFCDVFGGHHWFHMLPLGAIICTAVLTEALPVERVPHDPFGDYSPGRWAWRLDDVFPVTPHIPAKGMQTWGWPWRVPPGVEAFPPPDIGSTPGDTSDG